MVRPEDESGPGRGHNKEETRGDEWQSVRRGFGPAADASGRELEAESPGAAAGGAEAAAGEAAQQGDGGTSAGSSRSGSS